MKGKKLMVKLFSTIVVGAVFLLVTGVACSTDTTYAPKVSTFEATFPGDANVKFRVNSETGCIDAIFDEKGEPHEVKKVEKPPRLKIGKEIKYFGSLTAPQCRQGVIALEGSPVEFIFQDYETGWVMCIFAIDFDCDPPRVYPCDDTYPECPR